jgi:hypothetical protein
MGTSLARIGLQGGMKRNAVTPQDVAASPRAGNQPSWLSKFGEWRQAAVMSRTANTPVATLGLIVEVVEEVLFSRDW